MGSDMTPEEIDAIINPQGRIVTDPILVSENFGPRGGTMGSGMQEYAEARNRLEAGVQIVRLFMELEGPEMCPAIARAALMACSEAERIDVVGDCLSPGELNDVESR